MSRRLLALALVAVTLGSVLAPAVGAAPAGPVPAEQSAAAAPEPTAEASVPVGQPANGDVRVDSVSDAKRVAQQSDEKVDVVFVIDDTGSMGNNIDGVRRNIRGFVQDIEEEGIDGRYALITFSYSPELDQGFTSDPSEMEEALADIRVSGGTEDNFDALEMATEMDFRDDAKRVIVDITDEDADFGYGVSDLRMPEVKEFMEPFAAYVAVSEDPKGNCASPPTASCRDKRALAGTLEGGNYVDLGQIDQDDESDFGDILDTVKSVITEVVDEPGDTGFAAPDIEYVNAEFNRTTVPGGGTVRVNVTAVNEGDAPGSYIAAFRSDFRLIGTQRGRLAPGESVRLSANITFEDTGDHRVFAARDYLGTVTVEGLSPQAAARRYLDVRYAYLTRLNVRAGESYTTVARVTNTDDEGHQFALPVTRYGGPTDSSGTFYLESGESRVIRHERTPGSVDGSRVTVVRAVDTLAGNLTLHPGDRELSSGVRYAYVTDVTEEPGPGYELVAVVRNAGDESRRFTLLGLPPGTERGKLDPDLDGAVGRSVTVAPGSIETVRFEVDTPRNVGADGQDYWTVNGVIASYVSAPEDDGD